MCCTITPCTSAIREHFLCQFQSSRIPYCHMRIGNKLARYGNIYEINFFRLFCTSDCKPIFISLKKLITKKDSMCLRIHRKDSAAKWIQNVFNGNGWRTQKKNVEKKNMMRTITRMTSNQIKNIWSSLCLSSVTSKTVDFEQMVTAKKCPFLTIIYVWTARSETKNEIRKKRF